MYVRDKGGDIRTLTPWLLEEGEVGGMELGAASLLPALHGAVHTVTSFPSSAFPQGCLWGDTVRLPMVLRVLNRDFSITALLPPGHVLTMILCFFLSLSPSP